VQVFNVSDDIGWWLRLTGTNKSKVGVVFRRAGYDIQSRLAYANSIPSAVGVYMYVCMYVPQRLMQETSPLVSDMDAQGASEECREREIRVTRKVRTQLFYTTALLYLAPTPTCYIHSST
jgi:hypothetical protein